MLNKENLIVRMEFGSTIYGTRVPESDTDYKGVMLPPAREILLQRAKSGISLSTGTDGIKNSKDDVDDEMYWLHNYTKLLSEGQTGALDMLFTPKQHIIQQNYLWNYIQVNRGQFLSKNMKSFIGYCVGQASKYSLKGDHMAAYQYAYEFFESYPSHTKISDTNLTKLLEFDFAKDMDRRFISIVELPDANMTRLNYIQVGPKTKVPFTATTKMAATIYKEQFDKYGARAKAAMDNKGLDLKALLHAVRVISEGIELCKTGHITFPRPEAALLLQIRKNELPFQQISEMIDSGVVEVKEAMEKSSLPEKPNIKFIDDFVAGTYANHIYQRFSL